MTRKAWIAFVVVQLFGELGPWAGLRMKSSLGPALWVAGIVLMMPGRLLGLYVTEKLLWNVGLTPHMTTALFVLIEVPANLLVWLLCAYVFRSLHNRRVGKGGWRTLAFVLLSRTTYAGALPSPTLGGWAATNASLSFPLLLPAGGPGF